MGEYTKPWLSLDDQLERLASRGVAVDPRDRASACLRAVGYYRLTGYLYPFRCSEQVKDADGKVRTRVLSGYRPDTSIAHIARVIDFDRQLRMLVMDGVERIEVALRMQAGYVLGRRSPFAHLNPATFLTSFVEHQVDGETGWKTQPSKHAQWLQRVAQRRASSDETFVAHFRDEYDGQMPIWALTEILELGQLATLYRGLNEDDAQEIAEAFAVPTKKLMASWLASLNYVRNVAAHHARLFNRKLQNAPARPRLGLVPLLDHLRDEDTPKGAFGVYNALAVIAYMLRSVDRSSDWCHRLVELCGTFPSSPDLTLGALGGPREWTSLNLWEQTGELQ
ncbi:MULTISPECIES: Abi family protein [Cellulosimicrobium]|uniref:Abi family protein n=1 Tax=Cellulosimicrobium TaxID=157920 RepID=UPI001BA54E00|nr:Abi family protein [Cellulosimicrobium cellulans]QUC01989.1 Abi family protein [Cellulosimicrobium cellulans]